MELPTLPVFTIGQVTVTWREILDILLVSVVYYRIILLVKGTRTGSMLIGLVLLLGTFYVSAELDLHTLNWLLDRFLDSLFLVIIILFQHDIRKALSEFGTGSMWRNQALKEESTNQLTAALMSMAARKIGALVVLENKVPLGEFTQKGVRLNADLTRDLLVSIFFPNTPLHDGAVIVRGDKLQAAGCILPLAAGLSGKKDFGTRHRAALGISEESDALALVVSEERGEVSIAYKGVISMNVDEAELKNRIRMFYAVQRS